MTRSPDDWPARSPLEERTRVTPERTALIAPGTATHWTYRELADRVEHAAAELRYRTPEPGSGGRARVGYLFDPGSAFVTTLYACWHLGWTPVGLHTDLSPVELETCADLAELDAVVVGTEYVQLADAVDCPAVPAETLVDPEASSSSELPGPAEWDPDETALVLFTSGTTSEPKGVRLTLRNLTASATASAYRLGVDPADRWLCCLPVSHMGGLAPAVRTTLYGTTLVVQREFEASETASSIESTDVTHVSLVPTQLGRLLDEGWSAPDSLSTVLLGGAPATDELLDRAERAGVPVYTTYGMTETASQIATARPDQRRRHPGTVGQPLLRTDVTILSEGTPAEPGTQGEIVVDGPTVTPGYLHDAHTEEAFGEYGFHTGDVGYQDEDGRLWVVGRVADVILTGGELVSPADVTETLVSVETVEDAAVVGLPDQEWGERVGALVVPADGKRLAKRQLLQACRDQLASFKVPKTIECADEIPRTASGTVDREAVRDLLES